MIDERQTVSFDPQSYGDSIEVPFRCMSCGFKNAEPISPSVAQEIEYSDGYCPPCWEKTDQILQADPLKHIISQRLDTGLSGSGNEAAVTTVAPPIAPSSIEMTSKMVAKLERARRWTADCELAGQVIYADRRPHVRQRASQHEA